ncbi:MAG: caspase family protein [Thermoguttaceae bacterium]|nr:caspase family protein [Thermoguttaceae bacterium]
MLGVSTLTFAAALAQESREWRDAVGRPIVTSTNEKLVGTLRLDGADDPGKVRIRMGGKTFRFTLANLSEADREYVEAERAKKNAPQTAATPDSTPSASEPTRTSVPNPAPALAEDASRALVAIPKDGVKRALLVGVDDYAEFADLKYAVADVEAIRERLVGLGFKPENIVELKSTNPANLRPSLRYIRRQVDALLNAAGPNDLLFLHFSGHGFQTNGVVRFAPDDAVATGDENVLDPETTISLTEIIERLKTSEAKFKWLIVDACRENPTGTRSAAANARALKNIDPNKGVLVLQSCAEGELSFEDADAGRGLFTGRLLEAFDGKADFDGDGAISALDVCKYVSEQTLAASKTRFNATQTPYFSGEFADFIVAEDLKVDGLGRAEWARADALYDEAKKHYADENYSAAETKINAALLIVADVPETNEKKRRYLTTQDDVQRASLRSSNAFKLFGKLTRHVATVAELEEAVEEAKDGDVIQIAAGTYRLNETLKVWGYRVKDLTLVGATGDKDDVRLITSDISTLLDVATNEDEKTTLKIADLSLEAARGVLKVGQNCAATATRCSFTCEDYIALTSEGGDLTLTKCSVRNKKSSFPVAVEISGGDKTGGSLKAEDCDFSGSVQFSPRGGGNLYADRGGAVYLEKCKIGDCDYGVDVKGLPPTASARLSTTVNQIETGRGAPPPISKSRCELVECEIEKCRNAGVNVDERGQVFIRGGKICDCDDAIACAFSSVYVENTEIRDCKTGLNIRDDSVCEATNLTFYGVDKKYNIWQYQGGPSRVTFDGDDVSKKSSSPSHSRSSSTSYANSTTSSPSSGATSYNSGAASNRSVNKPNQELIDYLRKMQQWQPSGPRLIRQD